jgi:LacI family transcriptional regulator
MPKVTISDVAREANVSKQTVSRAFSGRGEISEQTRTRILAIGERLGFRPSSIARSLATQRTYSIGVTVPEIIHPFYAELVTAMQHVAWEAGYSLFQVATGSNMEREHDALRWMVDHWVDGVVCCRLRLDRERLVPLLSQFKGATLINRAVDYAPDHTEITHDNAYAMTLAVNHLVSVGCRNIALLGGRIDTYYGESRVVAFGDALRAAGVVAEPEFLRSHTLNLMYDWADDWMKTGLDADAATVATLRAHPDIDGLIGYNDMYAIGAMRALSILGRRVPDDVAVMGIDDIPLARLVSPSLTTLNAQIAQMGARAVEMVISSIEGRATPQTVTLQHSLVTRESTARLHRDEQTD